MANEAYVNNKLFAGGGNAGVVVILPNQSGDQDVFTSTGTGEWFVCAAPVCSLQTIQTGSGDAVVEMHGSNSNTVTPSAGTLLCTLTTASDGDSATQTKDQAAYKYKCAKVTTLTATSVKCLVGF